MKYYFLIPVYNESENLKLLKDNLINSLVDNNKYFVFVDDFSTDNTVNIIKELFPENSYHIIIKTSNIGPGDSFNKGFEWILTNSNNENDIVITMEGDNTSDISILPTMVEISKLGFSLVLASVYAQGGGFEQTTFFRIVLSFFANMLFRSIFNIKVLTLSSFYRIYHIDLIKQIKAKNGVIISEKGFLCMLEILLKAIKLNARIIEVPMILHTLNRKGKSKMKIIKTTFSYIKLSLKYLIKK